TFAPTAILDGVEQHGADDDYAGEHHLPVVGDADNDQPVGQETDDERAQQRAAHIADAAGQGGAADHHGGDGGQLVSGAGGGAGRSQLRGQHQASDGGANAGQDVHHAGGQLDRHARQLGGAGVAAGRVQPAAKRGAVEYDTEHDGGDNHDEHAHRNIEQTVEAEPVETGIAQFRFAVEVVVGQAVGNEQRDAAHGVQRAQRS